MSHCVAAANVAEAAVLRRAWNEGYPKVPEDFTITEKAPTSNKYI